MDPDKIIEAIPELWKRYLAEKGYLTMTELPFTSFVEWLKKKAEERKNKQINETK